MCWKYFIVGLFISTSLSRNSKVKKWWLWIYCVHRTVFNKHCYNYRYNCLIKRSLWFLIINLLLVFNFIQFHNIHFIIFLGFHIPKILGLVTSFTGYNTKRRMKRADLAYWIENVTQRAVYSYWMLHLR